MDRRRNLVGTLKGFAPLEEKYFEKINLQVKAGETEAELQKMEKKAAKLEAATASGVEEAAALEEGLRALQAAREQEGSGHLTQLEDQLHVAVRKEAAVSAGRKNLEETAASDAKRRQQVQNFHF
jgi:hypothetical protein